MVSGCVRVCGRTSARAATGFPSPPTTSYRLHAGLAAEGGSDRVGRIGGRRTELLLRAAAGGAQLLLRITGRGAAVDQQVGADGAEIDLAVRAERAAVDEQV